MSVCLQLLPTNIFKSFWKKLHLFLFFFKKASQSKQQKRHLLVPRKFFSSVLISCCIMWKIVCSKSYYSKNFTEEFYELLFWAGESWLYIGFEWLLISLAMHLVILRGPFHDLCKWMIAIIRKFEQHTGLNILVRVSWGKRIFVRPPKLQLREVSNCPVVQEQTWAVFFGHWPMWDQGGCRTSSPLMLLCMVLEH